MFRDIGDGEVEFESSRRNPSEESETIHIRSGANIPGHEATACIRNYRKEVHGMEVRSEEFPKRRYYQALFSK